MNNHKIKRIAQLLAIPHLLGGPYSAEPLFKKKTAERARNTKNKQEAIDKAEQKREMRRQKALKEREANND